MSSPWTPVLLVYIAALLGSLATLFQKCEFYVEGQPPGWIFGVAWFILYILLAIAGYNIWLYGSSTMKMVFIICLVLIVAWPICQWILCSPPLAVITILVLLILVVYLIVISFQVYSLIPVLLIPVLLWLVYASYLDIQTLF